MVAVYNGSIEAWLESSLCERENQVANQVLAKGSTLLTHDEIDMLPNIRTNRRFMKFTRESHDHLSLRELEDFVEDKEEAESLNLNSL